MVDLNSRNLHPLAEFCSKSADHNSRCNPCYKQSRRIYKHTCIIYDQHGNDQLTNIMGNTSCNADSDQTEGGFFQHKCHNCHTKCRPCQAVQDTEQISKHKSNHQDTDNGNQGSLFKGILFQDKQDSQIGKPQLDPRDPRKNRDQ